MHRLPSSVFALFVAAAPAVAQASTGERVVDLAAGAQAEAAECRAPLSP